ncbi:hypothetical protein DMENIID0001_157100 [Sergentomyia squamirostris]
MEKIQEIKVENEEECVIESEIKVENEEFQVEDSIVVKKEKFIVFKEEKQSDPSITGTGAENFNSVKFEITEFDEESPEVLKAGCSEASKEPRSICIYCEKVFHSRRLVRSHLRRIHRGFPQEFTGDFIQCQLCNKVCEGVSYLKDHVQKCHPVEKLKFECALCGRGCRWLSELKLHMAIHMKAKPFRCKICRKTFRIKGNMKIHMRNVHGMKNVHCSRCPETFKSQNLLREHMISVHIKDGAFECHKCDKILKTENGFRYHLASEHRSSSETISCTICLKVFKHRNSLRTHMSVHSNKAPFQCHVCPKVFKQKHGLKRHLMAHKPGSSTNTEKPHKCQVCNKGFNLSFQLKGHSEIHNKEANFQCQECPKTFKGEVQLRRHHNGCHLGECTCPTCGKVCAGKYAISKHMLMHKHAQILPEKTVEVKEETSVQ